MLPPQSLPLSSFAVLLLALGCQAPEAGPKDCAGKCDGFTDVTWKYLAGEEALASCSNQDRRITCQLAPTEDALRPAQIMFGRQLPVLFPDALTDESPEIVLPEFFDAGSQLGVSTRHGSFWSGAGDMHNSLLVPPSGQATTYFLPHDVWRVQITKADDAEVTLGFRYPVTLAEGTFALTQTSSHEFLGFHSIDGEAEGADASRTLFLPASPGATVSGYFDHVSVFSEAPHFTLDEPGCYLASGGALSFDADCEATRQIVGASAGGADAGGTDPADAGVGTPDADLADDCGGTCDSSEVCVAEQCVALAEQTQPTFCPAPTRVCDPGDDADCADGHACVDSLCRRLSCQEQEFCGNTPQAVCEDDDADCADGNVCAEGLCRKLSCQEQEFCGNTPVAVCENSSDSASGHSCQQGVCEKDSCGA